jgi:hypothetical protein
VLPAAARERRLESIAEAVGFPVGPTQDEQEVTVLYDTGPYRVGVAKPGKEAFRDERTNVNDMLPVVLDSAGNTVAYVPGFNEIFRQLWQLHAANRDALVLLGSLAFRNAYMLDHHNSDGRWRYEPPIEVVAAVEGAAPVITSGRLVLPVKTYLFVLEALALNEDVKYWTLRGGLAGDIGRVNNLRTYVHVIAACLDFAHPFDVGTGLMRAGVAPFPIGRTIEEFEPLRPSRLV